MRTTLSLDDDVLAAARGLAEAEHRTLGEVVSGLARKALSNAPRSAESRNGVPLLPRRGAMPVVNLETVNRLRDEQP